MLKVELLTQSGKNYLLTGTQVQSPVLSPEASLVGLTGAASRTDMQVPGRSGVLLGETRYGAIEVDVEFYLHADTGEEMEQVHKDFRQAWHVWDKARPTPPCVFKITSDNGHSPLFYDAWLSRPLPGVSVDARRRTRIDLVASVLIPVGMARTGGFNETGVVTVDNTGDEIVYPKIIYTGAGGVVTSPSKAVFDLPPATEETVIDLDPQGLILDGALPEGIEPGESGTWVLPEGARLSWNLLIADPWA